jgi:hypothetical protein
MQSLNAFEDGRTIVRDYHFSFRSLDLKKCYNLIDRKTWTRSVPFYPFPLDQATF